MKVISISKASFLWSAVMLFVAFANAQQEETLEKGRTYIEQLYNRARFPC